MAWKGRDKNVNQDFNQLIGNLNNSNLQKTNNPAYQVIFELIQAAQKNKDITVSEINDLTKLINNIINIVSDPTTGLTNLTFLTTGFELASLPHSRQLLAGAGILFDDTVAGKRTVSSTATGGGSSPSVPITDWPYAETEYIEPPIAIPIPVPPGTAGPQGIQGPVGPIGLDGEQGERGDDGLIIAGPQGAQGVQGLIGPAGVTPFVLDGLDGLDGQDGVIGATGPAGSPGTPGTIGRDGSPGLDGQDGNDGPDGLIGQTGATGATGTAGKDGIQPDVLISLCARLLRRLKFLEAAANVDYSTDDLYNPTAPTDQELLDIEIDGLIPTSGTVALISSFGITIDGGGSAPATGFKGVRPVPYSGIITSISLYSADGLTGSAVIDIYKRSDGNPVMTSANSIAGSNKPTISTGTSYLSSSLSGTAFNAGDIFGFNLDSITTLTRVTLTINVQYNQKLF